MDVNKSIQLVLSLITLTIGFSLAVVTAYSLTMIYSPQPWFPESVLIVACFVFAVGIVVLAVFVGVRTKIQVSL